VRFVDLAIASERLAATRSRLEKTRLLVELLGSVDRSEVAAAVGWLVEEPTSGPLGVGPAQLWRLSRSEAPAEPTLTLTQVEEALHQAAREGRGAALARVESVFAQLTVTERTFFVGALTGSLRQGSLGGVMQLALAQLSGKDEAEVRRSVMLSGGVVNAAGKLLGSEPEASPAKLELFRPIAPMLASHAASVDEALARMGASEAAIEWKVDGVRAQVHKAGGRVAVFSRQGNDITEGCGPLLSSFASLGAGAAVVDGEIALVGADGKARPFQDSFSAVASKQVTREGDRLQAFLFDCLHRDGGDLIDEPLGARLEALQAIAPPELVVPRLRSRDVALARSFYAEALDAGHEGVVVKDLASPYQLGARGRAWQKVKEHTTVDLVVLAVEWGSGRRKGLLSNLHLGARRADGTFCMVGKTFKGLTDEMLRWQTARLQELATERDEHVVHVRPELVVEIRFNDVQRSPRYPGGIALRFARVVRHREDKPASDVEPLESLVALLPEAAPPTKTARKAPGAKASAARRQLSLFDD
jgi:DNA ligase-1